ncbi:tail protein X [Methylobacterium aquaticum]|uniref:Tail X family protein n=1 Tax=Methylobacterium aquaticum TaxID=270351 RepID=A0A0C6FQ34_9HYPH|nr:tail protein X [Methylobacterium aquaticum]BAQ50408.1 tail X family protein [Methylobacterium aquaticum]
MPQTITVTGKGVTLALLLWRAYGRAGATSAMRAAALRLNPGLAGQGPEIPLLTRVRLPDLPAPTSARPVVSLFD